MILIVDNDKDSVQILSDFLKENGYEVLGCNDGNNAVKQAGEIKPRVVILNCNLPDINGMSVLNELGNIGNNIKIIMISNNHNPDLEKEAKDAKVFAFLIKPVDLGQLLELIKKAMR